MRHVVSGQFDSARTGGGGRGRRSSLARRGWALVVGLAFASAFFETAVPDIHDGDASIVSLGQGAVDAHLPEPSLAPTDTRNPAPAPGGAPSHSTHVDHCAHGHTANTAFGFEMPTPTDWRHARPNCAAATLASIARGPQPRPPIA